MCGAREQDPTRVSKPETPNSQPGLLLLPEAWLPWAIYGYFPISLFNDQNFYILCIISQNEQSTGWRQGDAASGPEDGNHKHDGDGNRGGHRDMPKAGFGFLFYLLLYPDI